ncbi:hypothetical protein B0T11DRAFT_140493 [Plectosphaerella cucumerina]|uniref:Uncharacterized protein n=1 Tax=Plectosphaerella cucumerina TaxID=40658 RepID=A0A8K0T9P0_9PEZI|nr:hypothetical protein B0T11DRAFT_140493 [Plectosphaerella cucumerina]
MYPRWTCTVAPLRLSRLRRDFRMTAWWRCRSRFTMWQGHDRMADIHSAVMQRGSARREPQASGHIKGQPHAPRDGRPVLGQAFLFDALILPRRAVTERGWLWTTIDRESWNVDRRHHELGLKDGHIGPRLGSKAPAANAIRGMCPWRIPPREEQRLICTRPLVGCHWGSP